MWAKIITIKRTKYLNYFSLCSLNVFNTRVSQFELNYWNKWTFPRHSNLLRCTFTLLVKLLVSFLNIHDYCSKKFGVSKCFFFFKEINKFIQRGRIHWSNVAVKTFTEEWQLFKKKRYYTLGCKLSAINRKKLHFFKTVFWIKAMLPEGALKKKIPAPNFLNGSVHIYWWGSQ